MAPFPIAQTDDASYFHICLKLVALTIYSNKSTNVFVCVMIFLLALHDGVDVTTDK